jgi:hypothetical protein
MCGDIHKPKLGGTPPYSGEATPECRTQLGPISKGPMSWRAHHLDLFIFASREVEIEKRQTSARADEVIE